MERSLKYSDLVGDWLLELGYKKCFFVAGGNIMHLIESFSSRFEMIPVIHEVSAVIAADYANEISTQYAFRDGKSFALVTVGPGVTNTVSGVAGAFIDGRELLVIGGQVKSSDLKSSKQRQKGVQEADGVSILESITKHSFRLNSPLGKSEFYTLLNCASAPRKGPVYLEICLDIQGSHIPHDQIPTSDFVCQHAVKPSLGGSETTNVTELLTNSSRPIFLVGGGFPRGNHEITDKLLSFGVPIATTWHGADRIQSNHPLYAGRPNMFGQRWANVVIQQSDLIIALGTTLAFQQTGFNIEEFAPEAKIVHVDVDAASLDQSNFPESIRILSTIEEFIPELAKSFASLEHKMDLEAWVSFIGEVRSILPLVEAETNSVGFINPFEFISWLSSIAPNELIFVPCSSGGSYTSAMQVFETRGNQVLISSKGLGSMGVGLAGAIGAVASTGKLTWLLEGDGGFLQNVQELGTVAVNNYPLKIILLDNDGYASIRTTQKKYFQGNYIGCDSKTGLGMPDYELLAAAYGIRFTSVKVGFDKIKLCDLLLDDYPRLIVVSISPDQQFLPKIDSRLNLDGSMVSNPIHEMSPKLDEKTRRRVLRFIQT
jgi:acetolactate synthase-1/2/3 large subunit